MKKILLLLLAAALVLSGCGGKTQKFSVTYLDVFDTVTQITGTAESQAEFTAQATRAHEALLGYHQLFDIYNEYDGSNLKTVNDNAGIAPVKVDGIIIRLLLDCRDYYEATDGRVNAAMGSVLALWHEARTAGLADPENAALPDENALAEAAKHCSWDTVIIDEAASTVFLTDPAQRLDVGAIAKGWAAQRVADTLPAGYLLNLGGNVCATGPKEENSPWVVGVNDPDGGDYLEMLALTRGSAVTSGDYQRTYTVAGQAYHHIIDPDTGMPGAYWRSVTILCEDSGLADALSTALFLMERTDGQALLDRYGAEAMWVDGDGNCFYSPGFEEYLAE